jgi:CDP-diacylglycerol--glycerol-3-phosphate 3-phosphatidyltransferase
MTTPTKPSPWNLPNAITIARILLVPVVLALLFASDNKVGLNRWAAVGAFVLSIATDGVDGAIARKKGLITDLGKLLDPIADKALIGGSLVALSIVGSIDWWITALILFRELGITIYRLVVARKRVLAANTGGKVKTVLQAVAVGFYLSPLGELWQPLSWVQAIILYAALVSTLSSGLSYVAAEIRLARAR